MRSIYDPSGYPAGVPNPYGVRVHAWNGGPMDMGTRYHGAVPTRPMWSGETVPMPLNGLGAESVNLVPIQEQLNRELAVLSACRPVAIDGAVGPRFCGAMRIVAYEIPDGPTAMALKTVEPLCEGIDGEYWPVHECGKWPPQREIDSQTKTEASMVGPAMLGVAILGLLAVIVRSGKKEMGR